MLRVFVSIPHEDLEIFQSIEDYASDLDHIDLKAAELYRRPGEYVVSKIRNFIDKSDVVVVVWTEKAETSIWIQNEIGYTMGRGIRIIPFKEMGLTLKGFLEGTEYIEFVPSAREKGIKDLLDYLMLHAQRV